MCLWALAMAFKIVYKLNMNSLCKRVLVKRGNTIEEEDKSRSSSHGEGQRKTNILGEALRANRTIRWYSILIKISSLYCLYYETWKHLIWELLCAEMVEAMKKVAELDVELTLEERNLVSVGYRTVIGAKRNFWRTLSSVEHKEWSKENEENVKRIKNYCKRVEDEIAKVCNGILSVIDKHLLFSSHRLPLWNLPYFATHCESSFCCEHSFCWLSF